MSGKWSDTRWPARWRRHPAALLRFGFATAALLFLMADDGISPDEFQCEVAAAHLMDCCPALPPGKLSCAHGGCESNLTPDIAPDRAACLQQRSCEDLVAQGACDMANWETVANPSCAPACTAKVPPCH